MTLILNCITADYLIQVSDRRLTWITNPPTIKDDNENKVVLFQQRAAFSYTGLAEIGGKTDNWIGHSIKDCTSVHEACEILAKRAANQLQTSKFQHLSPSQKRHAFVCIYWESSREQELQPRLAIVSNFQAHTETPSKKASPEFDIHIDELTPNQALIFRDIGHPLAQQERKHVIRALHDCIHRHTGPRPLVRILIDSIRREATRLEAKAWPTIGKNLLIISMPRSGISEEARQSIYPPDFPKRERNSFLYLPEDADVGIQYGPIFVTAGGGMISGYKYITDKEEIEKSRARLGNQKPPMKAIVLTEQAAPDTVSDSYRPKITDMFDFGWQDITAAPHPKKSKGKPYEYYGLLIQITKVEKRIINEIRQHNDFVLLADKYCDLDAIIEEDLLAELRNWFFSRGMSEELCQRLTTILSGKTIREVIDALIVVLRQPKNNAGR